jgi:uncharacterized membrane protein YdbT with pleckstrin-like domain
VSYIDETLGENERVLYRARIHPLFYIRIWALFLALTAFSAWVAYASGDRVGTLSALALFVASALFCLRLILPLWTLEIALTNLRIVVKRGFITRQTHELELYTIEEVNLRQSFLGRLFDYGMLDVRGIGDVDDLILPHIAQPLAFRKTIQSAIQHPAEIRREVPAAR